MVQRIEIDGQSGQSMVQMRDSSLLGRWGHPQIMGQREGRGVDGGGEREELCLEEERGTHTQLYIHSAPIRVRRGPDLEHTPEERGKKGSYS